MRKNILVTGANGQLGNEMLRVSEQSRDNYIFTDKDSLDITSADQVQRLVTEKKVDVIINCAAYTNVDKAEDDEVAANLINHLAVNNLAKAAQEVAAVLIHVSTDYVFKGDDNVPYREDLITNPLGVYGKTKLAGELAIQKSGCQYFIFRTAWLYSKFGNNFVKTMLRLTSERKSLKVVYDQVGTPTYAGDLAALIYYIVDSDQLGKTGIYHYTNEGVCSWYDFAKEVAAQAGNSDCDVQPCYSNEFPSKVKRPHFSVLAKEKVKESFDISIPYWKDSLKKCIKELTLV